MRAFKHRRWPVLGCSALVVVPFKALKPLIVLQADQLTRELAWVPGVKNHIIRGFTWVQGDVVLRQPIPSDRLP